MLLAHAARPTKRVYETASRQPPLKPKNVSFGFSERAAPAKSWVTGILRTSAKKATSKSDTQRL